MKYLCFCSNLILRKVMRVLCFLVQRCNVLIHQWYTCVSFRECLRTLNERATPSSLLTLRNKMTQLFKYVIVCWFLIQISVKDCQTWLILCFSLECYKSLWSLGIEVYWCKMVILCICMKLNLVLFAVGVEIIFGKDLQTPKVGFCCYLWRRHCCHGHQY